jgi:hypothetical protein
MPRKSKYDGLYEVGHKFGDWELLRAKPLRANPNNKYDLYYSCRCKCGVEKPVLCYNLIKEKTTRCYECSTVDKIGSGNPFWKGSKVLSGKKFYRIKRGAELRGIALNITIEEAEEKLLDQNYICALTGMELTKETWSLDRIDSSKPYEIENIQWVHKDINLMKNKLGEDYFIEMCKKVAANN